MSSSSHHHRSHRKGRDASLLQAVLLIGVSIAGLTSFVAVCLAIPGGRTVLLSAGLFLALATLAVLSCIAGQLSATIVNVFRLAYGRADLELTLKRHRHVRR